MATMPWQCTVREQAGGHGRKALAGVPEVELAGAAKRAAATGAT
jgi:hypothetical protein